MLIGIHFMAHVVFSDHHCSSTLYGCLIAPVESRKCNAMYIISYVEIKHAKGGCTAWY